MKKLLLVALATVFAFSMNAQKFGARIGGTMSGYVTNFDPDDGAKMGMGLNIAALAEYPLTDAIDLKIDLGFNQGGNDVKFDGENAAGGNTKTDVTVNVNYLQLAVNPKYKFGSAYFFAGPYFGYAISSKMKGNTQGDMGGYNFDIDFDHNLFKKVDENGKDTDEDNGVYNKTDLGLNLGAGTTFSDLFVELKMSYGMANFLNKNFEGYENSKIKDGNPVAAPNAKNLMFGLSIGYMF